MIGQDRLVDAKNAQIDVFGVCASDPNYSVWTAVSDGCQWRRLSGGTWLSGLQGR